MVKSTARTHEEYKSALVATGLWLGMGAGLDAYLIATHKERVITDVLRTKPGMVFMTVLCLHVANVLCPVDPFRIAAKAIGNKFPTHTLSDSPLNQ